ncbi:DUF536 domain-containing protein [Enterococcus faecium]|uniref:DUF536 domain-containing protein n=1 Tax=Enterococcus faecium TaxID=1352 RepID=UPI0034A40960
MADKTIKELAEEIGVSKQAVWQKLKKDSSIDLQQFMSKKGNTVYVSKNGQNIIKSMFKRENKNINNKKNVNVDDNELTFLKDLIYELQNEKKELHKLLDQQQQLTLQANQQLEKLQEQLQLTYAEEPSENKSVSDTEEVDKAPTSEKKWWQFWQ